ncbi:uncharacterized protein C19orf47 homolog [Ctenocephalides felis]|uniref:uncharacterized protein C19orf47 homolog n=1 Tax=Ctenocephalides felis TaxID=7515 RepID=UPI000E6E2810|nr:uncharacterized protein C19orf47 homolog [Ctenocephalides felis]
MPPKIQVVPKNGKMKIKMFTSDKWIKFFTNAGIPSQVSASYALLFDENRIQTDMLIDLNEDYLREMGITRIGDIIAILKHAKSVHEQAERDRILDKARDPVAAVASLPKEETGKSVPIDTPDVSQVKKPARTVLPEHNVGYRVILPQRITQRSKEILEKKKYMLSKQVAAKSKPSIFRRLGMHHNSRQVHVKSNPSTTSSASVFNRLGKLEDELPKPKSRIIITAQSTNIKSVKTAKQHVRLVEIFPKSICADQPEVSTKERINLPNKKTDIVNKQYKSIIKAMLASNAKRDANKSFNH